MPNNIVPTLLALLSWKKWSCCLPLSLVCATERPPHRRHNPHHVRGGMVEHRKSCTIYLTQMPTYGACPKNETCAFSEGLTHRHGFQTSPSIPIHPHPPSKPNLDGRFCPFWETPHFPSKPGLDGLPRPRASQKSSPFCAAQPFLSGPRHGVGKMTPSHWASIISTLVAGLANCSPRTCPIWSAVLGGAGGTRSILAFLRYNSHNSK